MVDARDDGKRVKGAPPSDKACIRRGDVRDIGHEEVSYSTTELVTRNRQTGGLYTWRYIYNGWFELC